MRNVIIFFAIISLFLSEIRSEMMEEERKYLYNKVFKKLNILDKFIPSKNYYDRSQEYSINYDPKKIKEIIKKYSFPEEYDFRNEDNVKLYVKNQQSCGSCWAFASTSALSYRFFKKGINVDLSPQYCISCYLRDCNEGEYLIDSQFYLVKNGTVTEECLPYSSGNGIKIERCPSKCKDGSKLKKYYAVNAYQTQVNNFKENYYDIVTMIIDQLINNGPVVSGIIAYTDFSDLYNDKKCKDKIYRYDGQSESEGGHAVVIVGYGYENSKYYWIIQNSWGPEFCDGGFAKIEFGQIDIEKVAFSEVSLESQSDKKDISVQLTVNEDCTINFNSDSNNTDDNSFELYFINDSKDMFYYQCGLDSTQNNNNGTCEYSNYFYVNKKGEYKYIYSQPLKTKNTYTINSSNDNKLNYYGVDYIDSIYGKNYYYSEENTNIFLADYFFEEPEYVPVPKIYPNQNIKASLKNCDFFDVNGLDSDVKIILCKIKKDEINYFEDSSQNLPLAYDILCGSKEITETRVVKLDKTKYPVFRAKNFTFPESKTIDNTTIFTLIADIEGSISGFKEINYFGAFIQISTNTNNYTEFLDCELTIPPRIQKDYEIKCTYINDKKFYWSFKEIYLLPYVYPKEPNDPFEVIIENNIKAIEYIEDDTEIIKPIIAKNICQLIRLDYSLLILFFLLL